jgi:sensor c-di-GMP phosphodiesterase-like protein
MITVDDVRAGMDRGELILEYQPIVSLDTRYSLGAEALVRWHRAGVVIAPRRLSL